MIYYVLLKSSRQVYKIYKSAVSKIGTPIHRIRPDPGVDGSSSGRSCISQTQIKDSFIIQYQQFLDNIVSGLITLLKVCEN